MIKIALDKKKSSHNLSLTIDEIDLHEVTDTYYFALDNAFMPSEESEEKVILNLKELLRIWKEKINRLQIEETIFLPFDFSDQYVGVIKINEVVQDQLTIGYGYTKTVQGSGFNPSNAMNFKLEESDYIAESNDFIYSKRGLLYDIDKSKDEIA